MNFNSNLKARNCVKMIRNDHMIANRFGLHVYRYKYVKERNKDELEH